MRAPATLEEAATRLERLVAALKSVEWGGTEYISERACCPACGVVEGMKHETACVLAKALEDES